MSVRERAEAAFAREYPSGSFPPTRAGDFMHGYIIAVRDDLQDQLEDARAKQPPPLKSESKLTVEELLDRPCWGCGVSTRELLKAQGQAGPAEATTPARRLTVGDHVREKRSGVCGKVDMLSLSAPHIFVKADDPNRIGWVTMWFCADELELVSPVPALRHVECEVLSAEDMQVAVDARPEVQQVLAELREPDDAGVIRAAEGVTLEPGEYEVVELDADDPAPALSVGERVTIREACRSTQDSAFGPSFGIASVRKPTTFVYAVRRVAIEASVSKSDSQVPRILGVAMTPVRGNVMHWRALFAGLAVYLDVDSAPDCRYSVGSNGAKRGTFSECIAAIERELQAIAAAIPTRPACTNCGGRHASTTDEETCFEARSAIPGARK